MSYRLSSMIAVVLLFITLFTSAFGTIVTPTISTIREFKEGEWLENLAIGPDSNSILVTRVDAPLLYQITLSEPGAEATGELIYTFFNATSLLGITESPTVKKIADILEAWRLNGMTTLNHEMGTVMVSDCIAGKVYRFSTRTGEYEVVLEDDTMKAPDGLVAVAVNGIRTVHLGTATYFYYANSNTTTLNRVPIDLVTGRARGDYETGEVYVAGHIEDVIALVNSEGVQMPVIEIAQPSSLMFGVGARNRTLYGTTFGGQTGNGSESRGD